MKIDTEKHLTNNEKLNREEIKKEIMNSDKSKLQPRDDFSDYEKDIFNYVIKYTPALANIDIFVLNSFVKAVSNMTLANEHLNSEGYIVDGKINPYYGLYQKSSKAIISLADKLNMTPMSRAKHGLKLSNSNNIDDPIKELMLNDWLRFRLCKFG